eukprot:m.177535 g.177535  ORF g.177535 m.177535 type:complete len:75 (-) comp15351_c0_seq1:209-433(-)
MVRVSPLVKQRRSGASPSKAPVSLCAVFDVFVLVTLLITSYLLFALTLSSLDWVVRHRADRRVAIHHRGITLAS